MPADSDSTDNSNQRARLTWRKKLIFSVLTTAMFFGVVETALILLGVQPATAIDDPFVGFAGTSPLFVTDDADDVTRMVTAPGKLAYFNKQSFSHPKPDGVFRIFCLGGSTTYGRPYDDSTSYSAWLREFLPRIGPKTDWEVINSGGVSYASYRIARLAEELSQYEPDLFIVYTGHNEFLEERTYREVRKSSPMVRRLHAVLGKTKTFALARSFFGDTQKDASSENLIELPEEVDAVLDHTVGPSSYDRNDTQRKHVIRHFEFNLSRICQIAERAGASVLLVTPASNVKDCSPFKSDFSDAISEERQTRWREFYNEGRQHEREKRATEAIAAWDKARQIDSRSAELHWRLGRLHWSRKQYSEAKFAFQRAIDEDICPLRAVSGITQAVRRTATNQDIPLVNFEQLLADRCQDKFGHELLGKEFFLDHVHPTIEAHGLLATEIIRHLIESGQIQVTNRLTDDVIAEVTSQIESQIDDQKNAIALRNLAKVLNWAGKHSEAGSLAMRAVDKLPKDAESLVLAAAFLTETGRRDQAIDYYRRALQESPNYATAHQMLGAALVDNGQLDEALPHFRSLAKLRPNDAQAWQMIGAIYGEQRDFKKALPNYRRAVSLSPNDANIHYNLANALSHLNQRPEAIKHFSRAIELNPNDTDAHHNLGVLLMNEKYFDEAARHFREVLRLRPRDKFAAKQLQVCLEQH